MNQFRVNPERAADFEKAWRERDSYLEGVPGFLQFHLLKGSTDPGGAQLYASHVMWSDEAAFRAWVGSDAFRKAHAQGSLAGILAGPPQLSGWTTVDLGRDVSAG